MIVPIVIFFFSFFLPSQLSRAPIGPKTHAPMRKAFRSAKRASKRASRKASKGISKAAKTTAKATTKAAKTTAKTTKKAAQSTAKAATKAAQATAKAAKHVGKQLRLTKRSRKVSKLVKAGLDKLVPRESIEFLRDPSLAALKADPAIAVQLLSLMCTLAHPQAPLLHSLLLKGSLLTLEQAVSRPAAVEQPPLAVASPAPPPSSPPPGLILVGDDFPVVQVLQVIEQLDPSEEEVAHAAANA